MLNWFLPVMFVSVPLMFYDITTLFRSGILIVWPLVFLIFKPIDFRKNTPIVFLFIGILICYIFSWQINEQSYTNFLFGAYGRNLGVLALIGLYLLTLESADHYSVHSKDLIKSFYILLGLAIAYGFIQILKLDPIKWEKGSGYGSTLGNPNFSSALLGILSIIPLVYFFKVKSYIRYVHLTISALTLIVIFFSGSSQGFILFFVNFLLYILFTNKINAKIRKIKKLIIILPTLIFSSVVIFLGIAQFSFMAKLINSSLQVTQRLEHWKLGYNIWKDHPIFGVGLDNMQKYGGEYRSLDMTRWGQYTLPDRSHNVLIDSFVFGGLIAGILHCVFIFLVFRAILRLSRNKEKGAILDWPIIVISSVWFTYFLQSLISPDHILLTACGMMAAGALLGIDNLNKKNGVRNE